MIKYLGTTITFKNEFPVYIEMSLKDKIHYCVNNSVEDFFDFVSRQVQNLGYSVRSKDVVFDGQKYTCNLERQ